MIGFKQPFLEVMNAEHMLTENFVTEAFSTDISDILFLLTGFCSTSFIKGETLELFVMVQVQKV